MGKRITTAERQAHKEACRIKPPIECEACQSTDRLDVHHENGNPFDNRFDNLTVLCRKCHRELHRKMRQLCYLCGKPAHAKRLCGLHYQRLTKNKDPLVASLKVKAKVCIYCDRQPDYGNMCTMHIARMRLYGDPYRGSDRKRREQKFCRICHAPMKALGLCNRHYTRLRRKGSLDLVLQ